MLTKKQKKVTLEGLNCYCNNDNNKSGPADVPQFSVKLKMHEQGLAKKKQKTEPTYFTFCLVLLSING